MSAAKNHLHNLASRAADRAANEIMDDSDEMLLHVLHSELLAEIETAILDVLTESLFKEAA